MSVQDPPLGPVPAAFPPPSGVVVFLFNTHRRTERKTAIVKVRPKEQEETSSGLTEGRQLCRTAEVSREQQPPTESPVRNKFLRRADEKGDPQNTQTMTADLDTSVSHPSGDPRSK